MATSDDCHPQERIIFFPLVTGKLDASSLFLGAILSSSVVTILGCRGTVPGTLGRTTVPALSWEERTNGEKEEGWSEETQRQRCETGSKMRNNLQQNRTRA